MKKNLLKLRMYSVLLLLVISSCQRSNFDELISNDLQNLSSEKSTTFDRSLSILEAGFILDKIKSDSKFRESNVVKSDSDYVHLVKNMNINGRQKKVNIIRKTNWNIQSGSVQRYRFHTYQDICWAIPEEYPNINCYSEKDFPYLVKDLAIKLNDFTAIVYEESRYFEMSPNGWFLGEFVFEISTASPIYEEVERFVENDPAGALVHY